MRAAQTEGRVRRSARGRRRRSGCGCRGAEAIVVESAPKVGAKVGRSKRVIAVKVTNGGSAIEAANGIASVAIEAGAECVVTKLAVVKTIIAEPATAPEAKLVSRLGRRGCGCGLRIAKSIVAEPAPEASIEAGVEA